MLTGILILLVVVLSGLLLASFHKSGVPVVGRGTIVGNPKTETCHACSKSLPLGAIKTHDGFWRCKECKIALAEKS